jgi:hypothetical protein
MFSISPTAKGQVASLALSIFSDPGFCKILFQWILHRLGD